MTQQHEDRKSRGFWSLMKTMTWKQRFEHIAYYYLKFILIGAFLLYICVDVVYDSLTPEPEIILSGTVINVQISDEISRTLTDDAFTYMGGTDPDTQTVRLEPNPIDFTDLYAGSNLQTRLMAGDYHYCLMDRTGMEKLLSLQLLPDLSMILTPEQLASVESRLCYLKAESTSMPFAIDITNTVLAQGCSYEGDYLYLAFPVIEAEIPNSVAFMDYLISLGLLEIP